MTDGILLRAATSADAEAMSALTIALTRRWIAPDCDPEGTALLLDSMTVAKVHERLQSGHHHVVAERDGRRVGVAVLRLPSHLYHLFVAEEAQRCGVSRALWNAVRTAADPAATITVNASLHALEVYQRLGFQATGPQMHERGMRFVPMAWTPC